jgi:hypothetical protein
MHFEKREKYLLITSEGERNEMTSVTQNTDKIYSIIQETTSNLILLDYRKVQFNISLPQTFNSIRYYEHKMPSLVTVFIAAVVKPNNMDLGKFWSDLARERGFRFYTFIDFDEAEKWLLSQKVE